MNDLGVFGGSVAEETGSDDNRTETDIGKACRGLAVRQCRRHGGGGGMIEADMANDRDGGHGMACRCSGRR